MYLQSPDDAMVDTQKKKQNKTKQNLKCGNTGQRMPHFVERAPGGGHWPRKGVWGCAALKTPFSRLSCRSQGSHFKQKSQFTRPPFEKIWKF